MLKCLLYIPVLLCLVPVTASSTQLPKTGLAACFDSVAKPIPCKGTGQDGELRVGVAWPEPRFTNADGTVPVTGPVAIDRLTGLMWTRDLNLPKKKVTWQEALDYVKSMNEGEGTLGYKDWRLPNANELQSLGDLAETLPALPKGHPFINHEKNMKYWSSTTSAFNHDQAWGMIVSFTRAGTAKKKSRYAMLPVRTALAEGAAIKLPKTGQTDCYNAEGKQIACAGTGQDGDFQNGAAWPQPRFTNLDGTIPVKGNVVLDQLTGLTWARDAYRTAAPVTWQQALDHLKSMNAGDGTFGYNDWRMPNINEMASLVDFSQANPALSADHPFKNVQPTWYWSSSNNAIHKEIVWGVMMSFGREGHDNKANRNPVWPVRGGY